MLKLLKALIVMVEGGDNGAAADFLLLPVACPNYIHDLTQIAKLLACASEPSLGNHHAYSHRACSSSVPGGRPQPLTTNNGISNARLEHARLLRDTAMAESIGK